MENPMTNPEVVSTKEWLITILLMIIPIVNIVLLFLWALGGNANPNKANWAKATLIWFAITIVLYVILGVTVGAAFFMFDGGM
ncbi:MAG: hypothetical protein EA411_02760 [Saprospirales bacterium]|nr:MAG: hypothetical protein EA411_02760 [Saprospirales bacterium]